MQILTIRRFLLLPILACITVFGCVSTNDPSDLVSVDSEYGSLPLDEFLEESFQGMIERSPIYMAYLGIKKDSDKWDNVTDQFQLETLLIGRKLLRELKNNFDRESLNEQDKLSYDMFIYEQKIREAHYKFRYHHYNFDQMYGVQSHIPAFLINIHKVQNKKDMEDYISRLEKVRIFMRDSLINTKIAAYIGIRPPQFVYGYVLSDARNVINGIPFTKNGQDSPLWNDLKKKVAQLNISKDEKQDLLNRGKKALIHSVKPAYIDLISYMLTDRKKANTKDGVWKHKNGEAFYAERLKSLTTTDMTADEIHNIGLQEVNRIHREMEAIIEKVGYEGTLQEFFIYLRDDPQFYFPNNDQGRNEYINLTKELLAKMEDKLPEVFNLMPKAELKIKRVEPFREKSAGKAFYNRPAPDGSRPGMYYLNLYDMNEMPIPQLEALAYHEALPGHHMQLAIAQELQGIPKFRKYGGHTAYIEGWGLYSEYLPKEMGFYEDPYSDFGRLSMELWRAARLVVDTGLHSKKWSREQASQYLIQNTPNPEKDCRRAIDRYIVMPGQATAYKIGMMKILELREMARSKLGESFNIAEFHDVILGQGSVPLSIMEKLVAQWVESKEGKMQ